MRRGADESKAKVRGILCQENQESRIKDHSPSRPVDLPNGAISSNFSNPVENISSGSEVIDRLRASPSRQRGSMHSSKRSIPSSRVSMMSRISQRKPSISNVDSTLGQISLSKISILSIDIAHSGLAIGSHFFSSKMRRFSSQVLSARKRSTSSSISPRIPISNSFSGVRQKYSDLLSSQAISSRSSSSSIAISGMGKSV